MKRWRATKRLAGLLLVLLLIAGCASRQEGPREEGAVPGGESLHLVATTSIIGDVVRQVAGADATLDVLIPVGTDPHAFQPDPRDIAMVTGAELLFIGGLGLEGSLEPLLENVGGEARIVALSEELALEREGSGEGDPGEAHEHAGEDAHVWFDPTHVIEWVRLIERELSGADPENAPLYQENAARYIEELRELDAWIAEQVATVPAERRTLVTDHQVLGSFASRYGFEEVGAVVQGISTAEEPSAQELAALLDRINASGARAIFVGNTVNPALAEAIARDSGATVHRLYIDSLSDESGPAPTYLEYMRYNVGLIVEALR